MRKQSGKFEFLGLLSFLTVLTLLLTNGFAQRISAQEELDVYKTLDPIGQVLDKIQKEYVLDADMEELVEGALKGMMERLDRHSSFIGISDLEMMRSETRGEFFGVGVSIKSEENAIVVVAPIEGSPASLAGILPGDIIMAVDGEPTEGMSTSDARDVIRGPKGSTVDLTILRRHDGADAEVLEISVERDKVPLESVKEARILDGGIAYIRISDFKESTARDMRRYLRDFLDKGMTALVLDLRWNPGGLLNSSREVTELFLPRGSLVTYTRGRGASDDMRLRTEQNPVLPPNMPLIVLVNESTASSSEIVTGALQYHERAIILGEKTFGKGSVQTIIPLLRPASTALRLTTALYYTPGDVSINKQGIIPDVEVTMTDEEEARLWMQLLMSAAEDPNSVSEQNHGSVTGNAPTPEPSAEEQEQQAALLERVEEIFGTGARENLDAYNERNSLSRVVEDEQLKRAVEILKEESVWENLLKKYHRNVQDTQMALETAREREQLEAANTDSAQNQKEEAPQGLTQETPAL